MSDLDKFKKLLKGDKKLVCMLAPSFIADFEYPDIVWKLRQIGFDQVVELTFGAKMTNIYFRKVLKKDDDRTWIASPCPTIVQLVRTKYPHLEKNLVPVHSPMGSMGMICKKYYPEHTNVFVGPCLTKKVEANELEEVELALTFRELEELLQEEKLLNVEVPKKVKTFDKFYNDYTKIYPLAGGLAETLHYKGVIKKKEILVSDGIKDVTKILDSFKDGKYKDYRFLDVLACFGGCIGGPGMTKSRSVEEKKNRVRDYRKFARNHERDLGRRGKKVHVEGIDFYRKY